MFKLLKNLFRKASPCTHSEVTKDSYGGFFDFDTFDCVRCGKHWDEAVVFSNNEIARASFRKLKKKIKSGSTTVVKDDSVMVTDFMTSDSSCGLEKAKRLLDGQEKM